MKYFVLEKHVLTYVKINKQSHIFKIYTYIPEEYLHFIVVLKMKYLCINSFCHSRYEDSNALL